MEKKKKKYFTSESVTEGHPDKMCDQISDAVLDEILKKDKNARVACETVVNNGLVLVTGEITTDCYIDIQKIVRETVKEIGYTRAKYGFDYETCGVMTSIEEQSADIALGVNQALESKENGKVIQLGAGDQGMMFGYACNETSTYMPMPIHYAHLLAKRLTAVRKNKIINYLRPDGKSQVTIEYNGNVPKRVDTVVVSSQHKSGIKHEKIEKDIIENVIKEVIPNKLLDENTKYYINPTGSFVIGGPKADSGLTGRKIIVDTYGGYARHGGGAFSGKDPTKVDRSAAYAARYVAKNLVAANLADKLEVQLAYAIGVAHPVSVDIDTFGTEKIKKEKIIEIINEIFDLRPSSIISSLNLKNPIYKQLAAYGHFGREDLELSWERLDKVEEIKKRVGI